MRRMFRGLLFASLGAAAAFLFDPECGRARRARLIDQSAAGLRQRRRTVERRARLIIARMGGSVATLRGGDGGGEPANDPTLKERVESELLADPAVPKGALNINAEQGIVVLRGEVPDDDMRAALEERAAQVRGVWYVENLLHLPGEPATPRR